MIFMFLKSIMLIKATFIWLEVYMVWFERYSKTLLNYTIRKLFSVLIYLKM